MLLENHGNRLGLPTLLDIIIVWDCEGTIASILGLRINTIWTVRKEIRNIQDRTDKNARYCCFLVALPHISHLHEGGQERGFILDYMRASIGFGIAPQTPSLYGREVRNALDRHSKQSILFLDQQTDHCIFVSCVASVAENYREHAVTAQDAHWVVFSWNKTCFSS